MFDKYKMRERKKGVIVFVSAFLALGLRSSFSGVVVCRINRFISPIEKKEISILTIL